MAEPVPAPSTSDTIQSLLIREAKTDSGITVQAHASQILQVALWLTSRMDMDPRERNEVCLAACLHDVGKALTKPENGRWVHAPASADLAPTLLRHETLAEAFREAGLDPDLDDDGMRRVSRLCREHHGLRSETVFQNPAAFGVVVADALGSALVEGFTGSIAAILGDRYGGGALSVLDALGVAPWANETIHSIALPGDSDQERLLSEKVLERTLARLPEMGCDLVMRAAGTAWIAGPEDAVDALMDTQIATADLISEEAMRQAYVRGQVPHPPQSVAADLGYVLFSREATCLAMRDMMTRRKVDDIRILEDQGLTFDALTADLDAAGRTDPHVLAQTLYSALRGWLMERDPEAGLTAALLPADHDAWAPEASSNPEDQDVRAIATRIGAAHRGLGGPAKFIVSLIRKKTCCRSISMLVRQHMRVVAEIGERRVAFRLGDVAWVDGLPPADGAPDLQVRGRAASNRPVPCARCGLRRATARATSLLGGATMGDGRWASAGMRMSARICAWCHSAAMVSVPFATLRILGGARKVRGEHYIVIDTPFSRRRLAHTLADLGIADAEGAADAVRTQDDAHDLTDADCAMFDDILGSVPDETTALGIEGLRGSLPMRAVAGALLPGATPLATRAIFALPQQTLLGAHTTSDMNSYVLDMVSLGVVETLRLRLGPLAFRMQAASRRGALVIDTKSTSREDMRRAYAMLAVAEFRRAHLAECVGQHPHALCPSFVIEMSREPRKAINALIRRVMKADPWIPDTNGKIAELCALADRIPEGAGAARERMVRDTVGDLMDMGALSETAQAFTKKRGVLGMKTNRDLCGSLREFWSVVDMPSLKHWLDGLRENHCEVRDPAVRKARAALVPRIGARIADYGHDAGVSIRDIREAICDTMYLSIFSVSRARRKARPLPPSGAERPVHAGSGILFG